MSEKTKSYFPALYCTIYPMLAEIAKRNGYALTVHGSMGRDFDLVAIPWIDNPSTSYELIEALRNGSYSVYQISEMPTKKPHGRLAWNLDLGAGAYLDVSIMPTVGG